MKEECDICGSTVRIEGKDLCYYTQCWECGSTVCIDCINNCPKCQDEFCNYCIDEHMEICEGEK